MTENCTNAKKKKKNKKEKNKKKREEFDSMRNWAIWSKCAHPFPPFLMVHVHIHINCVNKQSTTKLILIYAWPEHTYMHINNHINLNFDLNWIELNATTMKNKYTHIHNSTEIFNILIE